MIRRLIRTAAVPLAAVTLAATLAGCVVVPVPHARVGGAVVVSPGYGYGPPPPPPPRYRDRRDWRY